MPEGESASGGKAPQLMAAEAGGERESGKENRKLYRSAVRGDILLLLAMIAWKLLADASKAGFSLGAIPLVFAAVVLIVAAILVAAVSLVGAFFRGWAQRDRQVLRMASVGFALGAVAAGAVAMNDAPAGDWQGSAAVALGLLAWAMLAAFARPGRIAAGLGRAVGRLNRRP